MTTLAAMLSRANRKAAQRALLHASLPALATLREGLCAVFGGDVHIAGRMPNAYASSFPSDIVDCRLANGGECRVLCKYEGGQRHEAHGHRGNVAYEADVYRDVLAPLHSSAPRWYGSYVVPSTGERWLVIEYVDRAVRVANSTDPDAAMRNAARWIGWFHAANASRIGTPALAPLTVYDADYYRQWAERTAAFSAALRERLPWLAPLCAGFADAVAPLLAARTVIHGEYAPKNTLVADERVCPVDWESAAIAAGEIDLASLTDGAWPRAIVDDCTREYESARWPAGAPAAFPVRLELARMYWNFRWLGERPGWSSSERGLARIENLRAAAERAGLLFHGARA